MKKKIFLTLCCVSLLQAYTIDELFSKLKESPYTKEDTLGLKEAQTAHKEVLSKLFPTVEVFGSYDNYNEPTNLLPVSPARSATFKDKSIAQPFSKNIYRYGVKFSMPLFVKSIYTLSDMAKLMQRSAKAKKRINLIKNEALLVGSDASLKYLLQMEEALMQKKKSLLKVKQDTKLQVKIGRFPQTALYKIDDAINKINLTKNEISLQKQKVIQAIQSLTGIKLNSYITLHKIGEIKKGDFKILQPLKYKIKAQELKLKASKEKFLPSVSLHGSYTHSYADAYNNGVEDKENYKNIGVGFKLPIINLTQLTDIQKSKVDLKKSQNQLLKQKEQLKAKADMLENSILILKDSLKYAKKNISNKQKLLKVAKVSFKNGSMTTEEYLRYEDDLVMAKANYYQIEAKIWQNRMELAVIYANNIEEIVR